MVEPGGAGREGSAVRDGGGPSTTDPAPQRPRRGQRVQRYSRGRTAHNRPGFPKAAAGPAVRDGEGRRILRRSPGAGRGGFSGAAGGGTTVGAEPACSAAQPGAGWGAAVKGGAQKKTDLGPFTSTLLLHYSATLRASVPGCSADALRRTTTALHSGSPSLLRATSGSMSSCESPPAFDFGLPSVRGRSRESRPPVGASAAVRVSAAQPLGSPPLLTAIPATPAIRVRRRGLSSSAARVAPAAHRHPGHPCYSRPPSGPPLPPPAGVTAPPRRYGRPPAAGESPASSSRRASPARGSTAYRPAP